MCSPSTFTITEKASLERKRSPTQVNSDGNGKIPQRSKYRRMQETLLACSEIHGGTEENQQPAIDGLFMTLDRYATLEICKTFIGHSKKLSRASTLIHKENVITFEESQQNINHSFSMLYAGGLLSKRKYAQSRSALGTFSTGYLQRQRLLVNGDIPLPKILSYKNLMSKVNGIDIGELLPVSDLLSNALTPEDRVDSKYWDLESCFFPLLNFTLILTHTGRLRIN